MLALTNPAQQTVNPGENVIFNTLANQSCCCKSCDGACWRRTTGSIKLCDRCRTYEVTFHANVAGVASTPIRLALAIGGEVIPYSRMAFTPTGTTDFGNLSITIPISNCCVDYDRVTVKNVGTGDVIVASNPVITVKRLGEGA